MDNHNIKSHQRNPENLDQCPSRSGKIHLRYLCYDPEPENFQKIQEQLNTNGFYSEAVQVFTAEDLQLRLKEERFDLLLADRNLIESTIPSLFDLLTKNDWQLPVIILSDTIDQTDAIGILNQGAMDYISRDNMWRLLPAVHKGLTESEIRFKKEISRAVIKKSEKFAYSVLDALDSNISVLNDEGVILYVNRAWSSFADENGLSEDLIGENYLSACENPNGDWCYDGTRAAEGIRAVIAQKVEHFSMEYECHSPARQRWFRLRVNPIHGDSSARVIVLHEEITERRITELALLQGEDQFRSVFETTNVGISITDPDGIFLKVNTAYCNITGYTREEIYTLEFTEKIHPEDLAKIEAAKHRLKTGESDSVTIEKRYINKSGNNIQVISIIAAVRDLKGNLIYYISHIQDISQQRDLESQIRRLQRMELVSGLAGGVAHDFNNILTVINGYCDLLLQKLPKNSSGIPEIRQIKKAGLRASSLNNQILAFSRKQVIQPQVISLNRLVSDTEKMLKRMIGENIDMVTVLDPQLKNIKADPSQIDQILMNLTLNARDVMPDGGKLVIETTNLSIDKEYSDAHFNAEPGEYIMLAISDTGMGMDSKTKGRIFEPFFTTKERGKGTGLGLSTVFGIVKQNNGYIWVYSEPDNGTTFKVFLPAVAEKIRDTAQSDISAELPKGTETILLVEDDTSVRKFVWQVLTDHGYQVLKASRGEDALQICKTSGAKIDMVITDVVMPGMNGSVFAGELSAIYPDVKIIYVSGYTNTAVVHNHVLDPETPFLQKPFSPRGLLSKIREVFNNKQTPNNVTRNKSLNQKKRNRTD